MRMTGQIAASTVDRICDGLWVMRGVPEQPLLFDPVLHSLNELLLTH